MPGTVTPTLTPAQILAHLNALGTSGALFDASVFALKDPSAPTKIGKFSAAGITAGQTRTYTLPDATGTVPLLGLAQTWSATQTFGAIDATSIGATTRGTGLFTTLGANGVVSATSGTAATNTTTGAVVVTGGVGISGAAWIGTTLNVAGASTLAAVAATTISASGQITSTVSTGTAPLVIASTTVVGNLNVSQLLGSTWAAPGTIGSGTPSSGAFTTLTANGATTLTAGTASTSTTTGTLVVTGGVGISGAAWIGTTINVAGAATLQSTLDVTGAVVLSTTLAVESVASSAAIVTVGSLNALAGTTQVGMYANLTGTSAGTSSVRGFQADVRSAAAAYTITNAIGFLAGSGSIGAGSTVTRFSGFHASNGHGATNKACLSYSTSATLPTFSGSYFFYNEVAAPSYTAGTVTIADATDATALGTAALVCSGGVSVALRLLLDGATGKTLRIVNSVANAAVATTLGSVGPTGSTAGNPQGWMRIDINGTDRYMPFW